MPLLKKNLRSGEIRGRKNKFIYFLEEDITGSFRGEEGKSL